MKLQWQVSGRRVARVRLNSVRFRNEELGGLAAYRNANARHQTGNVTNAATAPMPTISEISRASRPY
jgi:hypothetical protein